MRPVQSAGARPGPTASVDQKLNWCMNMIDEICQASRDEASQLAQSFTVTNLAASRSFDPTTATVAEVGQVLGTLISDMKKGGKNRVG